MSPFKPKIDKRCVDDSFFVWSHRRERLLEFIALLNSLHQNIKFTMEMEVERTFPFLDILLIRKPDGTLEHTVFRDPAI